MIKLSKRLSCIADYVDDNSSIVDIIVKDIIKYFDNKLIIYVSHKNVEVITKCEVEKIDMENKIVTVNGANITDAQSFATALMNLKSEAISRAYRRNK